MSADTAEPYILSGAGVVLVAAAVAWRVAGRSGAESPAAVFFGRQPTEPPRDTTMRLGLVALVWFVLVWVAQMLQASGPALPPELRGLNGAAVNVAAAFVGLTAVIAAYRGRTIGLARSVAVGVGAGVVTYSAITLAGAGIVAGMSALGVDIPEQGVVSTARNATGVGLVVICIQTLVLAPFAEEVFFRGLLMPALAQAMPLRAALVVQAIAFGVAHPPFSPAHILLLGCVGWAAGALLLRTRSLLAPILLHATFNGLNLVQMWS